MNINVELQKGATTRVIVTARGEELKQPRPASLPRSRAALGATLHLRVPSLPRVSGRVQRPALGETAALSDALAVLSRCAAEPSGCTLRAASGGRPGFAGGLYEANTGLVRFGYRDYDAPIGR